MMRQTRWSTATKLLAIVAAVVIFVTFASVEPAQYLRRSPVALPEDSEVVSVTASLLGSPMGFTHEAVSEFSVPPGYIPRLLAAFRPARREDYPAFWDYEPIGELTVSLRNNSKYVVRFGFSGKNSLCFNVGGVRCIRGGPYKPVAVDPASKDDYYIAECIGVEYVIREIHGEVLTGNKSQRLAEEFASLERSAGRRPPEIVRP